MTVRKGYFVDELWSFGEANSYNKATLYPMTTENGGCDLEDSFFNKWIKGTEYNNYIIVQASETFSYKSVLSNHINEINPPLYPFLLHTVCSLFPGRFVPWAGYFINLICFVLIQLILFKISVLFFKNEKLALLPLLLYGFSICSINTSVYLRMYSCSTVLYLLSFYLHLLLLKNWNNIKLFLIFGVIFIASFFHYYFFVYQFFLSVFTCLILLIKYRFNKKFWIYGFVALFAVASVFFVYPVAFNQLFHSSRGQDGISGISNILTFSNINLFLFFFVRYVFGFSYSFTNDIYDELGSCFLLATLICFYLFKKNKKFKFMFSKKSRLYFLYALLPSLCMIYAITPLSLKSGILASRYFFPLFPLFIVIICIQLYYLLRLMLRKKTTMFIMIICLGLSAACSLYNNIHEFTLEDSFEINRENLKSLLDKSNVISVVFEDQYIHSFVDLFINTNSVFATRNTIKDINLLRKSIDFIKESKTKTYLIVLAKEEKDNLFSMILSEGISIKPIFNVMNHIKQYSVYELLPNND